MRRKRKAGPTKLPVSARAVLARINRVLAKTVGGKVCKARYGSPADYFRVLKTGTAVQYVDLEDVAKELGVLKSWEVLSK